MPINMTLILVWEVDLYLGIILPDSGVLNYWLRIGSTILNVIVDVLVAIHFLDGLLHVPGDGRIV